MYWSLGPPLYTHSAPDVPPYKPRTVPAGASTGAARRERDRAPGRQSAAESGEFGCRTSRSGRTCYSAVSAPAARPTPRGTRRTSPSTSGRSPRRRPGSCSSARPRTAVRTRCRPNTCHRCWARSARPSPHRQERSARVRTPAQPTRRGEWIGSRSSSESPPYSVLQAVRNAPAGIGPASLARTVEKSASHAKTLVAVQSSALLTDHSFPSATHARCRITP